MLCFPILPFFAFFFEGIVRPLKVKLGLEIDWSAGTGGCFFAKPDGIFKILFWDMHIWLSVHVGQFFIVGTHSRAVQGSYRDVELNKFFWREML